MNKRVFIISGLSFLLIGLVFLLNSFSSITGAVVLENVSVNVSGLLGLIFVVAGIALLIRKEESELENLADSRGRPLILTRRFMKAVKRFDKGKIKSALQKIGTGKGNEEFLRYEHHWSVRGEGKYRVIYDLNPDSTVSVLDYREFHR